MFEDVFRRQVEYIRKTFRVVPLYDGFVMMKKNMIREPALAITFDDGFQNNYDIAFPIIEEFELPATIFLVTGLINTDETVWFCKLNRAIAATKRPLLDWQNKRYSLDGQKNRTETSVSLQEYLKSLPHTKLVTELRKIIEELGDDADRPIEPGSPFRMLDSRSIDEMVKSGLVEFGSHTHSHAILSRLSLEERSKEILNSTKAVEEMTSRPCRLFSYPNGDKGDFDFESMRILESTGVEVGVTTIEGINNQRTPSLELRRYGVGGDTDFDRFRCLVHHFITTVKDPFM